MSDRECLVNRRFPSHARRSRLHAIAFGALLVAVGCNGSSGGRPLPFAWYWVEAGGVGLELFRNVYRNSEIRITFSDPIDPCSVTDETFAILAGPDFDERVAGAIRFVGDGATLVFVPQLAETPSDDGDKGGFDSRRTYRIRVPGQDTQTETIRTRRGGGLPLEQGLELDFTVRWVHPLYFEPLQEWPAVLGFLVDLDGDGVVAGDTEDLEQSPEFFPVPDEIDTPVATSVRVGSQSLPLPNGPLVVGVVYDRAMDPASLLDHVRYSSPGASLTLRDRSYPCDEPNPGDRCRARLPVHASVKHFVAPDATFRTTLLLESHVALEGLTAHIIEASTNATDLVGRSLASSAAAVFITSDALDSDAVFESFGNRIDRDRLSTAAWSASSAEALLGTIGFGGDGSDGPFDEGGGLFDTSVGTGEWNFSTFRISNRAITVVGDKPAIIRVAGDMDLFFSDVIADGEPGQRGRDDLGELLLGGRGGPGGADGGISFSTSAGRDRGGDGGPSAGASPAVGGEGGGYGLRPGGGGGGGAKTQGSAGEPGDGEANGGRGGDAFGGDPWSYPAGPGGSGGGAGGNFVDGTADRLGGSGGGGGGAILFDVGGDFDHVGTISASGGHGGPGAGNQIGEPSGGGGGGSGGSIRIRARNTTIDTLVTQPGGPERAIGPAGKGGRGAWGFQRVEYLETHDNRGFSNPEVEPMRLGDPLGYSIGRSSFYPTNHREGETRWAFDGSDPATGALRLGGDVEDIRVVDADGKTLASLPRGITMSIHFSGAFENPQQPPFADSSTITDWVTDIRDLDGYPLIRFEVRIRGDEIVVADEDFVYPGVDDVRLRFTRP